MSLNGRSILKQFRIASRCLLLISESQSGWLGSISGSSICKPRFVQDYGCKLWLSSICRFLNRLDPPKYSGEGDSKPPYKSKTEPICVVGLGANQANIV